jgi:hypothetical protein
MKQGLYRARGKVGSPWRKLLIAACLGTAFVTAAGSRSAVTK